MFLVYLENSLTILIIKFDDKKVENILDSHWRLWKKKIHCAVSLPPLELQDAAAQVEA